MTTRLPAVGRLTALAAALVIVATPALAGEASSGPTFAVEVLPTPRPAVAVMLADVDEDDILDVVLQLELTTSPMTSIFMEFDRRVYVLHGNGDGTFTPNWTAYVPTGEGGNGTPATVYDVDADGHVDLVIGCTPDSWQYTVWRGDGLGGFAFSGHGSAANGITALAFTNLDGDDVPDVVVHTVSYAAHLEWGYGDGDGLTDAGGQGFFGPGFGTGLLDMQLADVDGDGRDDLVGAAYPEVAVRLGQPGGFGEGFIIEDVTQRCTAVELRDLDGDGDPDIVLAAPSDDQLVVVPNNGGGTLGAARVIPTLGTPRDVVAARLDAGRSVDLAAVLTRADAVAFHTGLGNLHFQAAGTVAVPDEPVALAAGDVDGDGDIDLVVASKAGRALTLLRNLSTEQ